MEEDRYAITIAMGIFMAIIATVAVLLRFEARRIRKAGYKTDDWLVVAALVCCSSETEGRTSLTSNRFV